MMGKVLEKLKALDENARVLAAIRAKVYEVDAKNTRWYPSVEISKAIEDPLPCLEPIPTRLWNGHQALALKATLPLVMPVHPLLPSSPWHRGTRAGNNWLKTNVHLEQRKKPLTTPLLSDLHEEFGGTIAPSAPKTVTESVEDKSCNLKKSKIRVSFKYKTEPRSAFEESDLPGLATNKKYAENQNEKRAKKSMYSTDHSADSIEKGKKHHPLVNDLITKENESASDNQARTSCPVKQNALLPLHFEDVLKNPTVKIIDLAPKETVLCFMEESHTNPIIFHDTAYIEMLFLAKRFTPYVMTYTRKNLVLEKNWEMLKGLFYDQPSIVSKPQRPKPVVQYKELTLFSTQRVQKSIKEKRKKKHDSLASKNTPPDTFYNLSRTISNITKRFVGYFEIDATQEKSAITDEFERIFSKTKPPPTRKFTTLPIKYESKPLKNTVEIRKLNNITPLDNLLSWKVNN
ncbi:uncharacterized protein C1orf141 homolog [Phodopus roborovskii]|uniref:uncharacterized protein C1orf141 homolog n=1 Tax=Phodopus roborovskii TaxID=109678 RepID=UPI0021E3E879|nr:uncharacterized protein C1orf141 homolog [Phodopus roborovskii]